MDSAVWGRAEKSNTPAKPAQITMIKQIISTSPYLLGVLSNKMCHCVPIAPNKLITEGILMDI